MQVLLLAREARTRTTQKPASVPARSMPVKLFDYVLNQCRQMSHDVAIFMADLSKAMKDEATMKSHDLPTSVLYTLSTRAPLGVSSFSHQGVMLSPMATNATASALDTETLDDPPGTLNTLAPSLFTQTINHNKLPSAVPPGMVTSSSIASVQSVSALGSMSSLPYTSGAIASQAGLPVTHRHAVHVQPLPGIVESNTQDAALGSESMSELYSDSVHDSKSESSGIAQDSGFAHSLDNQHASFHLELVPSLGLNVAASLFNQVEAENVASRKQYGEPLGEGSSTQVRNGKGGDTNQHHHQQSGATQSEWQTISPNYTDSWPNQAQQVSPQRRQLHEQLGRQVDMAEDVDRKAVNTILLGPGSASSMCIAPEDATADEGDIQVGVDDLVGQLSLPNAAENQAAVQLPNATTEMMWQYNAIALDGRSASEQNSTVSTERSEFVTRYDGKDGRVAHMKNKYRDRGNKEEAWDSEQRRADGADWPKVKRDQTMCELMNKASAYLSTPRLPVSTQHYIQPSY